jgi:hypothetical protein
MKRCILIVTALMVILAPLCVSYAAETTFSGEYRIRAWSNWNFDKRPTDPGSEKGLYTGYFDQRFRLTITHKRSEFLKAVVQLDLVEDTWGQQRNFRSNNVYTKLSGTDWVMNDGFVRKAYIEFKLPKVGTFTAGKQPQNLGYGLVFADTSGKLDGLKWANKWGPVAVAAMYYKWNDNVTTTTAEVYNRDSNIWALDLAIVPTNKQTIELFGGYVNYGTSYPQGHNLAYRKGHGLGSNLNIVNSDIGFAGIAYTGEFADMVTAKAEFSGVFGRADLENWGGAFTGVDDASIGGYNIYLDASYHNDVLRAGLAFVLGSGQTEGDWDDNSYNMNYITGDKFAFGNIIAAGTGFGGLNDTWYKGLGFCNDIENLTAVKLYFEITPMEKLTLNAAVIWAKWTEPVGAGTPYGHPVNYYAGYGKYTPWNDSTDLGWEIDLGAKYQIMEGLTYSLAAGVLFTGDSFDYTIGGARHDWGPIWMVNNTLTYEF